MVGISTRSCLILAVSIAALASGCATGERAQRVATYGAPSGAADAGADRIFQDGRSDIVGADASASQAQIFAAYEGVDGARIAHRLYGETRAEQLDGACEQFVKIANDETLYDIAQYCDVPVSLLLDKNPFVHNARHVETGQIVEVPQLFNAERHALSGAGAGVEFASWYVVQPGDTLNTIAARHLVSAAAIAGLNPGLDAGSLAVGAQLRIPAAAPVGGVAPAPVPSGVLGHAYGPASAYGGDGGYTPPAEVTAVMPYAARPTHVSGDGAVAKSLSLAIDRKTVKPGGEVVISAVGLKPNAKVSLYRGPNGGSLEFVKSVTTDAEGKFSEPVTVKSSTDIGGVIFRATVDDSGEQLQSPRVGVDKIAPQQ